MRRKYTYPDREKRYNRSREFEKRGLYRSKRGMILGVCRGLADYLDFSVFWIRVVTVLLLFITSFWLMGFLYIIAALLMKSDKVTFRKERFSRGFYNSYAYSDCMRDDSYKKRCSDLERRLKRLEHSVTTPEFDWERRLYS